MSILQETIFTFSMFLITLFMNSAV